MGHFPSSCINIFVILSLMVRQERNGNTVKMHLHLRSTIAKTLSIATVGALTLASLGNIFLIETTLFVSDFPRKPRQVWPVSLAHAFWAENVPHVNGCFIVKEILDSVHSYFCFLDNMSLQETTLFVSDFPRKPRQVLPVSLSHTFWAENVTHVNESFDVKAMLDCVHSYFGFLGQHCPARNKPICVRFP